METVHLTIASCGPWWGPSVIMGKPTIVITNITTVKHEEGGDHVTQTNSPIIVMDMTLGVEEHDMSLKTYVIYVPTNFVQRNIHVSIMRMHPCITITCMLSHGMVVLDHILHVFEFGSKSLKPNLSTIINCHKILEL